MAPAIIDQEAYYSLFKYSADGLLLTTTEGQILAANPTACQILGRTEEEICRVGRFGVVDSSDPRLAPALAERERTGHFQSKLTLLRADGTRFPGEVTSSVFNDDTGTQRTTMIIRDISESERLNKEREQYFKFFMLSTDPMCIADPFGCFKQVNAAFVRLTGFAESELISNPFMEFVLPEDRERTAEEMRLQVAVRPSLYFENHYVRKDRTPILLSWTAFFDKTDGVTYATARDITGRRHGEQSLERANRALRTLSACNAALVRAGNESELLDSICRLIVEKGGYSLVWVGFPERDLAKTVRPQAHYGCDEGYLAAAKFSWADTELGRGPTGTAIRTGTVQANQNFQTNPALAPWREAALKRGYQSSLALPLNSSRGILGVLTIYASEPDAFNEHEISLLQELAEDLAFGIENLRTRDERDRNAYQHQHHEEIMRQSLEESIKAIADTVEMRDPYTAGHQRRVGKLAVAIARELGLPEDTIRGIELAASIHDLGKISVPAEILAKPTKLSDIEFMLVKNHAHAGYEILKDIKFPWPIATIVLQHHEKLDGSGYPQGLKGEQILLESRIMAVADIVEAMASHRPYRAALGIELALREIERGRGTVYDAAVVDACSRLFAEKRFELTT